MRVRSGGPSTPSTPPALPAPPARARRDGLEELPCLTVGGPGSWVPPPAGLPAWRTRGFPDHPDHHARPRIARTRAPMHPEPGPWDRVQTVGRSESGAEPAPWQTLPPLRAFPENDNFKKGHAPLPPCVELVKWADDRYSNDVARCTVDNSKRIVPPATPAAEINRVQMDDPRAKLPPAAPAAQMYASPTTPAHAGGYSPGYAYAAPQAYASYHAYPASHGYPVHPAASAPDPRRYAPQAPPAHYPEQMGYAAGYPTGYAGAQHAAYPTADAMYPQGYAQSADPHYPQYAPAQYSAPRESAPRR